MKKKVLLYNFTPERVRGVRAALSPLDCGVVSVSQKDQLLSVGAVAGLAGYARTKSASGELFSEEMLVMYGFFGEGIDVVIHRLKTAGVGSVPLKAVVTETNAAWDGVTLYREIKAEHERMNGI
ncbi:MAG: DUF3783 domain-containing protein [Clostridia bacterium]|nr:DUF3783 domain-containing protein [Clostridia bacterium]